MGKWIKEEYEGVVAFLFIIVSAMVPWSVSYVTVPGFGAKLLNIRWWFGEFFFLSANAQMRGLRFVHDSINVQQGTTVYQAHLAWGAVTALFVLGLVFAVALFFKEDAIRNRVPVHLVAGGHLIITGIGYTTANIWLSQTGISGLYVPIGGLAMVLFGGFLVTNRMGAAEQPAAAAAQD